RTALRNAHQDSGETLRRRTALRNAHQGKVRMHPYFAISWRFYSGGLLLQPMASLNKFIDRFTQWVTDTVPQVVPKKIVQRLCWAILGLILANAYGYFFLTADSFLEQMLDLNREKNIPTAFSALLLLICAVLLRQIYRAKQGDEFFSYWRGLSIIFFGMTIDECLIIHEHVGEVIDMFIRYKGIFYYSWLIPGILFVLAFTFVYLRFIAHLPPATRRRFVIAGVVYLAGAVGMEMISGYYVSHYGYSNRELRAILNGIEEVIEMLGAVYFIRALLLYLQTDVYRQSCFNRPDQVV
ncbi:MAG: hypothetical protein HC800_13675, partial [Phormidesmis sp. RL_2_1]|nr:hypothetical protein [Phormidesmis sp. RL_2_1]